MSTESKSFTPGDTVYNERGRAGEYVMLHGSEHLVAPLFEDSESGEPFTDTPEVWRRVFATAPVPVIDETVAKRTARVA